MAIDQKSQCQPAIASAPDTAKIRGPALIRSGCDRWHSLDARSVPNWSLPHLPAFEFEDPLRRVLVEAKQIGDRSIAKGRLFIDQRLDRFRKSRIDFWRGSAWLMVDAARGHAQIVTDFWNRNLEAVHL